MRQTSSVSYFLFCVFMFSLSLSLFQNVIDLSDPNARDQFLATQFEMANQKMMEGKGYYYKCKIKRGSIPKFSMKDSCMKSICYCSG